MSYKNSREMHMYQAASTVMTYMIHVKTNLDELFGPGFSEEHPTVWKDLVHSCVLQYGADVLADSIDPHSLKCISKLK